VRHVLQGEPDDRYILRADFNRGIALLKDLGLVYDILIFERHLPQTLQFVDRHPGQVFVLDHIAKPRIKDGYLSPWQTNIVQLAHRPNIYCKLSGMVTEADYQNWTEEELGPYIDTVISAFGPKRVMFGSDWPVCLVACPYGRWVEVVKKRIAELTQAEQQRILGETAVEAYKL
jgi:L-fuconolactonase